MKISTQPYKGTKDYYPEDMFKREYLFNIWRETAFEFGYEEYDNPLLENAELYRAKSGDELANNQLYNFEDKGGREVAIKPEMTPSLARMIAAKGDTLPKPIRWFNISRYYRYEKPQRGRTREFYQLNIDIFGIDDVIAETEIFRYINRVMEKLNAPKDTYAVYVNNRYFMDYLLDELLKIEGDLRNDVVKAIDNYTKVDAGEWDEYLRDVGLSQKQVDVVNEYLETKVEDLKKYKGNRGADELIRLFELIEKLGITNIEFKPYIVRGLAYYTGTVFELFDVGSKENPRALFGGGRYDDLLDLFDQESIPAVGLGWGNVTMLDYLETYDLLPRYEGSAEYFVVYTDEKYMKEVGEVVEKLREKGYTVEQQLTPMNIGKQFKYAGKKGFKKVIIVGEEEIKKGAVAIKDMESGEQSEINL